MQTTISSIASTAQVLGPTTRDVSGRNDATRHVARPVSAAPGQSVESVRDVRVFGSFDERSGRVVTHVIDRANGEVVEQYPDEDALRVLAGIREMICVVVDEVA